MLTNCDDVSHIRLGPRHETNEELIVRAEKLASLLQECSVAVENTMPHYKDGTPARIGDIAFGRGYNETKDKGACGTVTAIRAGESCNMNLTYLTLVDMDKISAGQAFTAVDVEVEPGVFKRMAAVVRTEYGAIQEFVKVN